MLLVGFQCLALSATQLVCFCCVRIVWDRRSRNHLDGIALVKKIETEKLVFWSFLLLSRRGGGGAEVAVVVATVVAATKNDSTANKSSAAQFTWKDKIKVDSCRWQTKPLICFLLKKITRVLQDGQGLELCQEAPRQTRRGRSCQRRQCRRTLSGSSTVLTLIHLFNACYIRRFTQWWQLGSSSVSKYFLNAWQCFLKNLRHDSHSAISRTSQICQICLFFLPSQQLCPFTWNRDTAFV